MLRNGPMTVERALAAAHDAGCFFRLAGATVEVRGFDSVPADIVMFLRGNRELVFDYLGGNKRDRASLELLATLDIEPVYCTDDVTAASVIVEIIADAGGGPIAIDIETSARPKYANPVPLRLTIRGRPMKVQPKSDDKVALDPHRSEPRLVQLYGGGARVAVLDMRSVSWDVLAPIWQRPLVAHNAAFELAFLAKRGIYPKAQCTMQTAGLLLGVKRRSLAEACSVYLGIDVPKAHQTSDWAAPTLSRGQLAYAAADAALTRRLWERTSRELKAKGRDLTYRLQRDCLPAAAAMALRGVAFDLDAHAALCDRWGVNLAEARRAWVEVTGSPPPSKPADAARYLEQEQALPEEELSRWPRTSTGGLSTATDQLEKVAYLPAIRPLLRIKKYEKLMNAFGPKLRQLVNPETGRLHPHYNVAGTKAGRWSASDPNIQQLPKDADTRQIIVGAPGHVLISADYSQMELRAAAWIAGDVELTRAYEQGLDVHVLTAAAINGVDPTEVTKEQRVAAKPINFGSIYGMSAKGLVASAWSSYGVVMTEAEAKGALDRFFTRYSGLRQWLWEHAENCKRERQVVIGAGRVVENAWEGKWGLGYPQMCNLPVQGICADCMMRAIAEIHRRRPGILVAMIHDELLAEVPEDRAHEGVVVLRDCMTAAFAETFPGAPLLGIVDVKVGRSWAEVH
jgi:DNA polymerase I